MKILSKKGLYLAFQNEIQFSDDIDYNDTNELIQNNWYLAADLEKAKVFANDRDVLVFLSKKRGDFWKDFEIKNFHEC